MPAFSEGPLGVTVRTGTPFLSLMAVPIKMPITAPVFGMARAVALVMPART